MNGPLDTALARLAAQRTHWATLEAAHRAALFEACLRSTQAVAGEWVDRVCAAKGIAPDSPLVGEAWLSGPMTTLRTLRVTAASLRQGAAPPTAGCRRRHDQRIVTVTPQSRLEGIALGGLRAEVWLAPGAAASQGGLYADPNHPAHGGGTALVLGAGNISAIAAKDVVHKLATDNEVVMLKMHPVQDYLTAVFERAFAPLIEAGFLAICQGGAEVGQFLCTHELITSVHMTGSHRTFDAIVWGSSGEEQTRRKAAADPLLRKPVTAELGCVSPVLVVPGRWSERDIDYQAASVAGMVIHNASFNCTAAKAVVVAGGWPQRAQFLDALRGQLRAALPRLAYYPGAAARYQAFLDAYPGAEVLGAEGEGIVPWTLLPEVPAVSTEYALSHEAFCGVLAEVPVAATDPDEFLDVAVRHANDEIWGSLSCNILVNPSTERALGTGLEDAVAALRYGGVAVNTWSSALFGLATTTWGAYPGNRAEDVGSGIGLVGNSLFLDHPQKSVAYGTFLQWPKPPWWPGHRSLRELGQRWTAFEAAPSWAKLAGFGITAARG
jgi:hypothetical protein